MKPLQELDEIRAEALVQLAESFDQDALTMLRDFGRSPRRPHRLVQAATHLREAAKLIKPETIGQAALAEKVEQMNTRAQARADQPLPASLAERLAAAIECLVESPDDRQVQASVRQVVMEVQGLEAALSHNTPNIATQVIESAVPFQKLESLFHFGGNGHITHPQYAAAMKQSFESQP